MQNFADLHPKPETLAKYGLPDSAYLIPAADLQSALLDNGELPLTVMLHGLQQHSREENGSRSNPHWISLPSYWRPMGARRKCTSA